MMRLLFLLSFCLLSSSLEIYHNRIRRPYVKKEPFAAAYCCGTVVTLFLVVLLSQAGHEIERRTQIFSKAVAKSIISSRIKDFGRSHMSDRAGSTAVTEKSVKTKKEESKRKDVGLEKKKDSKEKYVSFASESIKQSTRASQAESVNQN